MKSRKVFTCAILSFALFQALATDLATPLYTSALPVDQNQVQSSEPIQLTKISDNKQSPETLRNNVIVAENHVVMLAELGATILERTATGLVKRDVLEFDSVKFNVSGQIIATTDSKHLLWFHNNNIIRLSIDANFRASVTTEPANFSCRTMRSSERSDEFVCTDAEADKYRVLRVTSQGLVTIAELAASAVFEDSTIYYSSKDNLLISQSTRDSGRVDMVIFKLQNGQFVETDRRSPKVAGGFYSIASVYDSDTGRLWLQNGRSSGNHVVVDINPEQGSIKDVNITSDNFGLSLPAYYYNPVISGDFFAVWTDVGKFLLQRQGGRFLQVTPTPNNQDPSLVYSYFRNASGKDEIWKNTKWSLEHFDVTGADWQLKETRSAVQRGLPIIDGQSGITSDDQRFFAFEENRQVRILTLDKNKQLQLAASSSSSLLSPFHFNFSKFLKIQTGQYLIATSFSYWVVTEDATGQIKVSAERAWPAEVKSVSSDVQIKVKDGLLYSPPSPNLPVGRVHVMQVKNDEVVVLTSLNDNVLTPDEIIRIYGIVELNGKLLALMPTLGKTAVLNFKDGQLSVTKTASMPNVAPPYFEGNNRIFSISNRVGDLREVVLMADAADNLQASYVSDNTMDGHLYQKRFRISQYISPDKRILQLNNDVTGVWQDINSSGHSDDWATDGASTRVLSGHLLTFSKKDPLQITNVYKLNSAPYMPVQIEPLKFNQGAETEIALQSYIRDDDQQQLIFSGLIADAFSLTEDGRLKYKGLATGTGKVLLTVDDGGLKTELTLPYEINAAPVLLKPLPVIMANQNTELQFDLNAYIADPEGGTVSFAALNLQGFALSPSGLLSGTAAGLSDVTVPLEVTDKAGAKLKSTVTIKINAAPVLTGSSSASGKVDQSFSLDLSTIITDAEKHRITLTAQGLPAGLSLSGAVISGTPTSAGTAGVIVTATDELGARSQFSLSLNIVGEDKKSTSGGAFGFYLLALLVLIGRRRSLC